MTAPYYQDDHVTLWHGDCREIGLPVGICDALVTDPPYAAAAATVTTGRAKQKWGGNWGDMSLVTFMAEAMLDSPILRPEHEVYCFADHLSYAALVPVFFRRYVTVQNIVWDKDVLGLGAYFRKQTEQIIYARTVDAPEYTSKSERDLIRMRPEFPGGRQHPAEKPVGLMEHLLRSGGWTCAFDPFAGSGTTLLAARNLGRRSIGVEVEERYCEIAAKRLSQSHLFGESA